MKAKIAFLVPILMAGVVPAFAQAPADRLAAALGLADDFLASGDPCAAALEYRRLAADLDDDASRPALHLLAADAYLRAHGVEPIKW